ncbi:MAG: nucleotide sugar dehydrogenase [Planctomycetes bacterium]|nr:nucleotide sugar dehydrogenase [Planctomycetota bacterium]
MAQTTDRSLTADGAIAILGGCGHVGLPLGMMFASTGLSVVLIDRDGGRVEQVNAGEMPFVERGAHQMLPGLIESGRLHATVDVARLSDAATVVITIGTPVDEFLDPSVHEFDSAMIDVAGHLRPGQLVVLRSTVFPGITEHLSRLLVGRGLEVDLAYCPERIAQGYALEELKTLPQIVSGTSDRAVERATRLFRRICPDTITLRPIEAELAKLFTNAWRYIHFAISNQFYILANKFDADFYKIHHAIRWQYQRMQGFASAGFTAGPCLLKDTMQLAAFNHGAFPLGQAAMLVNESLPYYVVQQLAKRFDLATSVVGILGMAFKANSDDPRSSLAYKLRKVLMLECRQVLCTDPYIRDPSFLDLGEVLERADVLVLGACHDAYRNLQTSKPIVDISNFLGQR